jgi:hypothetical protein
MNTTEQQTIPGRVTAPLIRRMRWLTEHIDARSAHGLDSHHDVNERKALEFVFERLGITFDPNYDGTDRPGRAESIAKNKRNAATNARRAIDDAQWTTNVTAEPHGQPAPKAAPVDDMLLPVTLTPDTLRALVTWYRKGATLDQLAAEFKCSEALFVAGLSHAGYSVSLSLEKDYKP